MNYEVKKAELENKIKELQNELETLEKQSKKEEWKKSLVEKFKGFLENMDPETAAVEIRALRDDNAFILNLETYFYNEPENTAKVESETKAEEKTEPKTENKPENKFKVGDYVFYRNVGESGEIISTKGDFLNMKTKENKIYPVRPEWIYKAERPTAKPENKVVVCSVPKPNETTKPKPVKVKMSLDELIKGME